MYKNCTGPCDLLTVIANKYAMSLKDQAVFRGESFDVLRQGKIRVKEPSYRKRKNVRLWRTPFLFFG